MNPVLTNPPTTDPAQLLRYRDRQYAAELITAGLMHLDFFTWLNENAGATTEAVCDHFDFVARPADVFFTLCRSNNFITTDSDGKNELTSLAREHLVVGSPWYLGPYYAPITQTQIVQDFVNILKTGKPANWQADDDASDWHESMVDPEFAKNFTDLMNCRGLGFGQVLAKALTIEVADRKHLLDVGGGSGIYSTTLVAAHPHLRATVLEQPPVDALTQKEIEKHGLADKVNVLSGDMFTDPWPADADMILFSNVLHDWDFPEMESLLEKAAQNLPSGGLLIIHDAFINDDKSGPTAVAEYSALLMNITQGKCYSPLEYGQILEKHGFEVGDYHDTVADRGYMTAIRK